MRLFFFSSFSVLAVSASQPITTENADLVLNDTANFPMFIYVWDSWCPHCKAFTPRWHQLSDLPAYQRRLCFADLHCTIERTLCHSLSPGQTFPRLIWLDSPTAEIQRYSGSHETASLVAFIRSQFTRALQIIESKSQIDSLIADRMHKSLFLFNITSNDNDVLKLVSTATFHLRHFPVNFALVPDPSPHAPVLHHLTTDGRKVLFGGEVTSEALKAFVKKYSIPFLSVYTAQIAQHAELEGIAICIFVLSEIEEQQSASLIEVARLVHPIAPVVRTSCDLDPEFCRYHGIRGDGVVFLNKSRGMFWVADLSGDILKWINRILASGIRAQGPGNGFLHDFWFFFYEMRGRGGVRYWCLYLPVVMFAVWFLFFIGRCAYGCGARRKTHKD
jgi:thiol-disulfide isomerase/thioredoxin